MKKVKIFILIISSSIPAFAIDPTPIIIDPITILPMMPVFFNTKTGYSTPLYRLYKNDWDVHTYLHRQVNESTSSLKDGPTKA